MGFCQQKRAALNNLLAAVAVGDLDLELNPLLDAINSIPDYYTTSSCSGRVALLDAVGGKGEDHFTAKWHRKVSANVVLEAVKPGKGILWFRYESPILHVMARTREAAGALLQVAREAGFKRSGIQSMRAERILIEILSTERVDAPIMDGMTRLADDDYMRFLVKEANMKHEAGAKKIERLHLGIEKMRGAKL